MKQVPEEKSGVDFRKTDYWSNLEIFNRHRGKLSRLTDFLEEILFDPASPYFCGSVSQLKRRNTFSGDFQVLATKLVQLVNASKEIMAREILKALEFPDYLLPGEITTWDCRPWTLLMFDPEKTFLLVKCILEGSISHDLDLYVSGTDGPNAFNRGGINLTTHELYKKFPTIAKYIEVDRDRCYKTFYTHRVLKAAYLDEVLGDFMTYLEDEQSRIKGLFVSSGQIQDSGMDKFYEYERDCDKPQYLVDLCKGRPRFSKNFLFLAQGNRKEILSIFPRRLQKRIASWQIEVPKKFSLGDFSTGLHEDHEHDAWKNKWPMLVARGKGCSHDIGAIFFPSGEVRSGFDSVENGYAAFRRYRSYLEGIVPSRILFDCKPD